MEQQIYKRYIKVTDIQRLYIQIQIYKSYEIYKSCPILLCSCPTLENCLFELLSFTKNNNEIHVYKYSRCGIGFDRKGKFSVGDGFGRNCIIFGVDMSSS